MKGSQAKLRILLCSFFLPFLAFSQDYTWHPQNALSLSIDYSQIKEENVTPKTFTGPGFGGALQRRYERDGSYSFLELSGYAVFPKTSTEKTLHSRLVSLALKYAYMVNEAFGNEHLSVGAFAKASFKNAYYRNYQNTLLYWANFYGAGVAFALEEPLSEKYAFEAVFEMPLVGAAIRPSMTRSYQIQKTGIGNVIKVNNSDPNFALPGNYLNPSLSLAILTSKLSLLRSVSYKYTHTKEKTDVSQPFHENNHALTFTFMIVH